MPCSEPTLRGTVALLLGCLTAVLTTGCGSSEPPATGTPDIVIVLVDTLRADHLGCYGYDLPTSPEIDDLAATATLFENHTTQSNSTSPSILSILTGVYPQTHRNYFAVPLEGTFDDRSYLANVAQRLEELDYSAHSVWSHPLWSVRPGGSAFDRGFESYLTLPQDRSYLEKIELGDARFVTDKAIGLLDTWQERAPDSPLLLLAHYFDPHTPYDPPPQDLDRFLGDHLRAVGMERLEGQLRGVLPKRGERLFDNQREQKLGSLALGRARYDEEIRDMSREVGRLLAELQRRDLFDDALVIFLADHGENMEGDDLGRRSIRFSHERLYEGVVGTPLVVKLPRQREARRIAGLSQNIDVLPTILELLGLESDPPVDGVSLVPLLRGEREEVHERVFSESSDQLEKAVKTRELKLIQPTPETAAEVYRWREDRRETRDVAGRLEAAELADLLGSLEAFRPEAWLRWTLEPDAEPFEATLQVRLTAGEIQDVDGDGWQRSSDGTQATWTGPVADERVELGLRLTRSLPGAQVRVAVSGGGPLLERLALGATPLGRCAVFELAPEGQASPAAAGRAVRVTHGPEPSTVRLHYAFDEPTAIEVEAAHEVDRYGLAIEMDADEQARGFAPAKAPPRSRPASALRSDAATQGTIELRGDPDLGALRWRVSVDGERVAREDLAIDAVPCDPLAIGFQWDTPADGVVRATLDARLPRDLAPGAVVLRYEMSGEATSTDIGGFDASTLDELRELGYVK
ncbi:sulfatase [Engelhardtia mirabilis]|uniref:Choline-sulfatase n=1 Tax=Engelhardtia mirabilis TaxID=2528011 RepID=A0A518BF85_9BACT|nr:Choline-sulfatase [Planctomycetes bacterium Pla133]QDU99969.1 Choline-sulfatase [Planctomycetes bacterium Pla86]